MIIVNYFCEECLKPYEFETSEDIEYICPECGKKLMYWCTEEVDPETQKVIKRYNETEREQANPGKPVVEKPTVECPYCHSKNTQRIKYGFWERFSFRYDTGTDITKVGKQFHCNNCDANF